MIDYRKDDITMNKREANQLLKLLNAKNYIELENILKNTIKELELKELHGNTFTKGIKAYKKQLGKMKNRPILQYCHYENGIQYATDSFTAIALKAEYHTDLIEYHNNENGTYPAIAEYFPDSKHGEIIEINLNHVAEPLKMNDSLYKIIGIPFKGNDTIFLDADYVKTMLLIFGNDATFKVYGTQRPVLIESERGRGLIVPIRPTDTLKTKWNEKINNEMSA